MSVICEEIFDESSHPSAEEIREYATKIGIDPDKEPELLSLAAEGLMTALPPGWKPVYDEHSQSYYYYNNLSEVTQWEHPLDAVYRELVQKTRDSQSQNNNGGSGSPPMRPPHRLEPLILGGAVRKQSQVKEEPPQTDGLFGGHPRNLDGATGLKITGGGSMFLKSNTRQRTADPPDATIATDSRRSILRTDEPTDDRSEEEKKSVRFQLGTAADATALSLTDDGLEGALGEESRGGLKVIKPYPGDLVRPSLVISRGSDSEEDEFVKMLERTGNSENVENIFESDYSEDDEDEKMNERSKRLENRAQKKIDKLRQSIWEEKNDELIKFKDEVQESHKKELERMLLLGKTEHEQKIKTELENLRIEMENRNSGTLKEERLKFDTKLKTLKQDLKENYEAEEKNVKEYFENKKSELEKYYDEKLADIEKELAEKVEKNRDELILTHNSIVEQLKQNHSIIIEELKKTFQAEESLLRREHQSRVSGLRNIPAEEKGAGSSSEEGGRQQQLHCERLRCEKRLLEDKYRCLKEKYLRLKEEVKQSIERRRSRRRAVAGGTTTATTTTGSETERSNSNRDSVGRNADKPPPSGGNRASSAVARHRQHLMDMDTSVSSDGGRGHAEPRTGAESPVRGRSRKPPVRPKGEGSPGGQRRTGGGQPRVCSPVENLRRQLQKLEELEDEFPPPRACQSGLEATLGQQVQDAYHLRYPFSPPAVEGAPELEFIRHRIHVERDSLRRAREQLRTQKVLFKQRQKVIGRQASHSETLDLDEDKDLAEMEVRLHRTRSLLGEKVIRLRQLEESLRRTAAPEEAGGGPNSDPSLSLSTSTASSGVSSTEPELVAGTALVDNMREPCHIMRSLESLNMEIKEIWDVLRGQQEGAGVDQLALAGSGGGGSQVTLIYPDMGWPLLSTGPPVTAPQPLPPSIPTLADRLHQYRQHAALQRRHGTMVTVQSRPVPPGAPTLAERTRNLRHWLTGATTTGQGGAVIVVDGGVGSGQAVGGQATL